jgi:pyruvate/2-oxoglutarate dehydrogenase complex dihydrolipoamide dehydrogenase (E3) component
VVGDHVLRDQIIDRGPTDEVASHRAGAGYVGLEMAEGLTMRGIAVTQVEMLPEVLPTVEVELGALVHDELVKHCVNLHTNATVTRITKTDTGLHVDGTTTDGETLDWDVDLVLVVVGVRPDTDLLLRAGAQTGPRGAVIVYETMATGLPHVWAAGGCVVTHHHLLGENALGGNADDLSAERPCVSLGPG